MDSRDVGGDNVMSDVIFVIESTAINGAYINEIKTNYLIPAIETFSQCSIEERDFAISPSATEKNSALYGIVLYETAQALPENVVVTYGPFNTANKIANAIDKLELTGGQSESNANLAEGLATALVCFEDLKELRSPDIKVQRHCILVCNSPPYSMPVQECYQYENKTVEQLATIFHEKKINFSVISPRKIPILFKLFTKAGGDVNQATKNYCKDVRHLVLLKGFNLKERPNSPSIRQIGGPSTVPSPLTSVANNMDNQSNQIMPIQAQQTNLGQQHPQHMNPQFQNNPPVSMQPNYPNPNMQPQVNRWLFPGQGQRPFMPGPGVGQQGNLQCQNPNSALLTQLSAPPNQPNQMLSVSAAQQHQQQQQAAALRMQIINQQQQNQLQQQQQNQLQSQQQQSHQPGPPQNQQLAVQMQQSSPSQHPSPQQQQQQLQVQPSTSGGTSDTSGGMRDREKIWSGVLEWIEKPKADQTKITRQVPCHVTANIKDGEPEVKAENWPSRLIMQLMPKQLVGNIGGQYLKDSKMVVFRPNACEALDTLSKIMISGFAGCVHFNTQTPSPLCDIKVLILLYTAEKKTFLGFIPNNQQIFVDRLRKVIQQKQSIGVNQMQQPQQQQQQSQQQQGPHPGVVMQGNMPTGPQQPPKPMETGLVTMPNEPGPHYNAYASQMQTQMQDMTQQQQQQQQHQQNEYKMNMLQQQRALMQQQLMSSQRMIRPIMSNNPGLRHLLQQQQNAPNNQFRQSIPQMPNAPMGGPQQHIAGRPPNPYEDTFDFM